MRAHVKLGILSLALVSAFAFAQGYIEQLNVDNLQLNGNTISSTNSNGIITVDPNGTGYIDLSASISITGSVLVPTGTDFDFGTSNTLTYVDMATGTGANTIAIGGANSTVNINGTAITLGGASTLNTLNGNTTLRLPHDTFLTGRNSTNDGDIEIIKVGTGEAIWFGNGRNIVVDGGNVITPESTGLLIVTGPADGGSSSGALDFFTGSSEFVNSGVINVSSGNTTPSGADSGNINIVTGDAGGDSGGITLETGTAGGTRGNVYFNESSLAAALAGYVWTLQDAGTGEGAWEQPQGSGGGITLLWEEYTGLAPIRNIKSNHAVYSFQDELTQSIFTELHVPSTYLAGNPIVLKIKISSVETSNDILVRAQATLVRAEVDDVADTTNQRTTTNSAITMSAANNNELQKVDLDITSASGEINGVAVSPQDTILIRVYRDTGTDTGLEDVDFYYKQCEVTFQ